MRDEFAILFSVLCGYLLGSISFSIILSRLRYQDDIRRHGSGNAGMTNTLRTYGKLSAALVLAGDAAKGALAAWIGLELGGPMTMYLAGLFAVIGHMFPVFFGFRGGKGVATAAGFILGSQPFLCLILAVVFVLVVWMNWGGYWQAGMPLGNWLSLACPFLMAALVIWAHRGNIKRLLAGTENKLGQKVK